MSLRLPQRQRGVALITAILVVALATVAAVGMATHQELDIRRTANMLDGDQAYEYALGVESWARVILTRDAKDNKTDNLGEVWAQHLPPLPVTGGTVAGTIEDLQGRFNLNNLVQNGQVNAAQLQYFQRLLTVLGLDPNLAQAVLDWMDADVNPRFPDGAEDDTYLQASPPYRAANRPMASVSELLLVKGFTPAVYAALVPNIIALPAVTAINVNTATPAVLQALAAGLTTEDAQSLVADRGKDGYPDIATFLREGALAGRKVDGGLISVSSDWFLVNSLANVGDGRARLFSVVNRNASGATRVVSRSRGTL